MRCTTWINTRTFVILNMHQLHFKDIQKTAPKLFDDDTNEIIFHKTENALFKIANTELDALKNWLLKNKL